MTATVCVCGRPAVAYLHPTTKEVKLHGPLLPLAVCANHACLNVHGLVTLDEVEAGLTARVYQTSDHQKLLAALDRIGDTA